MIVAPSCVMGPLIAEDGLALRNVQPSALNLRLSVGVRCEEVRLFHVSFRGERSYEFLVERGRDQTGVVGLDIPPDEAQWLRGDFDYVDRAFLDDGGRSLMAGSYQLVVTAMIDDRTPFQIDGEKQVVVRDPVYVPKKGEKATELDAAAFGCDGHFNGALDITVLTSEGPDIVDYVVRDDKLPKQCATRRFSASFTAEPWEDESAFYERPFDVALTIYRPGESLAEGTLVPVLAGGDSHPSDGRIYHTHWDYVCDTPGTHTVRVVATADTGATTEFVSMLHCLSPGFEQCRGSDGATYAVDSCFVDDWHRLDATCVRSVGLDPIHECADLCPDTCAEPGACP